jgi:hypothetical protein
MKEILSLDFYLEQEAHLFIEPMFNGVTLFYTSGLIVSGIQI